MLNQSKQWVFIKRLSRPPLTNAEVAYWKSTLKKNLKVGIEVELNLPDAKGTCDRENYMCQCTSVFKPEKLMPNTELCYEQCSKWDSGNCTIAKKHGCAGVYCREFDTPCSGCSKYDRGCESCPELYDLRKDPGFIRQAIGKRLKPTRFVGSCGATGTYKVCRDGSLLGDGGVEVATVGRRVQFMPVFDMVNEVMNACKEHGAYVNERCSVHVHLLASYLMPGLEGDKGDDFLRREITELERTMPEIIIANYHQLVRRYHCALIWLGAAGDKMERLTRWEKFRKPVLQYSAMRHKMSTVSQEVGGSSKSKRKYSMMNYEPMGYDDDGNVTRLHVEARYMDGNLSPSTVAAHACLLYGLMIKAVEISRYGLLQSGDHDYMALQKEIYANLCNGDGSWDGPRVSNTAGLTPYIPALIEQSQQLIRTIKNTLTEQSPADEILRKLAEKPLAYRIIEGQNWDQIEADLGPNPEQLDDLEHSVMRLIGLGAISDCDDTEEWFDAAAYELSNEIGVGHSEEGTAEVKQKIRSFVEKRNESHMVFWSKNMGGFIAG